MSIQFDQIPGSIRKPGKYFEFNTKLAVRTLPGNRQRLCLIGQRTSSGQVAQLIPAEIVSDAQAAAAFGYGSQLHLMTRAAITANPYVALTCLALDDAASGVPDVQTVTIGGAATAAGILTLWIGYQRVPIAIAASQAANDIATALRAAVNAIPSLPVTASGSSAAVILTAKNDGAQGALLTITVETTNACVATSTVHTTSGSVDPDIATALAVIAPQQYDIIVPAWNDATSLAALRTHLNTVSGPMEQRPGIGVFGYAGLYASAVTLASGVNSGRIACAYLRDTYSWPCELAAAFGAVVAFEEDPARPLNTLALTGIHAPAIGSRFTRVEQENCLYNGLTPIEIGPTGVPAIVRAITTYTVDANSVADVSLLDLTTIRTLDYVRKACRERIALRFPREKLYDRTVKSVRSELLDVLLKLEDLAIVENVADNQDGLVVERSGVDPNRLDAKIPADVVNGLHVFAGRIDLIL